MEVVVLGVGMLKVESGEGCCDWWIGCVVKGVGTSSY
jgi:hypothetical protein